MNKLIQRVNDMSELDRSFNEHEIKLNLMEKRVDYFKAAAESTSANHSLFSLLER
jgi:3-dehydroquinate dehydratase